MASDFFVGTSCTLIITVMLLALARISAVRVKKGASLYHASIQPLIFMSGVLLLLYLVNLGLIHLLTAAGVRGDMALYTALLLDDILACTFLLTMFRRNALRQAAKTLK
ncbi:MULTISPECIES: hypothetical protein [Chloracidobacterium]|jgi:hypothetical protein|nr:MULTISPECIES: hypothetical protein [Chloracidobacterium]QUV84655.1 hypothetical protein J8C03_11085 [Chloracidobacterium sp. 2]QUV86843.1 hypothetical protein J8C07_06400 [Chloracidobacterium sp. S]QUV91839.1 hypothetical protein J8C04_05520 [Chloracidobacterium sp. A]QUV96127.1 hypothetical protein J8C00_07280 [Chloracidobacterium sp. E]